MALYNSGFGHQQVLTDVVFARGDGDYVWDTDNCKYLDFFTNESLPLGHSRAVLIEAMSVDLPVNVGLYENAYRQRVVDQLADLFPEYDNWQFNTSGTLANEAALRYAMAITGRSGFAGFVGSYHGRAKGTASLTDMDVSNGARITGYGALPYPGYDPATRGGSPGFVPGDVNDDLVDDNLRQVAETLDALGEDHIAGVMLEPILAKSVLRPPAGWIGRLRDEVLQPRGILLLADECFTSGRVGHWSSAREQGTRADIITISKSFSNGYPFAAVACLAELAEPTRTVKGGDATSSQAPQCRAVSLTLERIIEADVNRRSAALERQFLAAATSWLDYPGVRRVSAEGALLGVEFDDKRTAIAVGAACIRSGVLLATVHRGIRLTPSLVIEPPLLDDAMDRIDGALRVVLNMSE